ASRTRVAAWMLHVPGIGKLLRSLDTARFPSTRAILVASGAPLLRSFDAASVALRRIPRASAATAGAALVRDGGARSARPRGRRRRGGARQRARQTGHRRRRR